MQHHDRQAGGYAQQIKIRVSFGGMICQSRGLVSLLFQALEGVMPCGSGAFEVAI
jgi:hypothetical protein